MLTIWDVATGQVRFQRGPFSVPFAAVAFSPDGHVLATGRYDGDVTLWDAERGRETASLSGHTKVVDAVAFSPDGKTLATASADGAAKLWDLGTLRATLTLRGHEADVHSVAISPKGNLVATAGYDGTVKLWDTGGREVAVLKGFESHSGSLTFSPDGRSIAAVAITPKTDRLALVWDVATGAVRAAVRKSGEADVGVFSAQFSPDGKLAVGFTDGLVTLVDPATGDLIRRFEGHRGSVTGLVFSPDGATLATGAVDGTVRLWDARLGGSPASRPVAPQATATPTQRVQPRPLPKPVRVGGRVREPRRLTEATPLYPDEAKAKGVEGNVILEILIDTEGRVADATVLRGIRDLDQAAIDAVKKWVYEPTLVGGSPVPVLMTVVVRFRLSTHDPQP